MKIFYITKTASLREATPIEQNGVYNFEINEEHLIVGIEHKGLFYKGNFLVSVEHLILKDRLILQFINTLVFEQSGRLLSYKLSDLVSMCSCLPTPEPTTNDDNVFEPLPIFVVPTTTPTFP